jgi:arylsulfatase A-like enzyme
LNGLLLLWLACAEAPVPTAEVPPAAQGGDLVLLISWDTTRADALGAYGDVSAWGADLDPELRPVPQTPQADRLAQRGVRFRWALSHAPTTLNAHASIFTGEDPHVHGVPRNGEPLSGALPVLAERFAAAGWDTISVVGSTALEARMGLNRGFGVYDDQVSTAVRHRVEDAAPVVVSRTLRALDARPDPAKPLFLFVHFYDAHSPWTSAPADLRESFLPVGHGSDLDGGSESLKRLIKRAHEGRLAVEDRRVARGQYLAEVAHQDLGLGALLVALEARGYGPNRLVMLTADHGETLEEIPASAYGHSTDVNLGVIHVPLIVQGTGRFSTPPGVVIDRVARLSDLGTTLLTVAGIPGGLGAGQDLSLLWRQPEAMPPPPPHFAEATKPRLEWTAGVWPNLQLHRAVVDGGHMATRAAISRQAPALFTLAPGQPPADEPARLAQMVDLLATWDATTPGGGATPMTQATREGLEALGYLDKTQP